MSDDLSLKYGAFYKEGLRLRSEAGESDNLRLKKNNIPEKLIPLLPNAEFWGISDDSYRIELVRIAPNEIWNNFRELVSVYEDDLLDWLAGPEAKHSSFSPEYLAHSFMLQAFDWPRD